MLKSARYWAIEQNALQALLKANLISHMWHQYRSLFSSRINVTAIGRPCISDHSQLTGHWHLTI